MRKILEWTWLALLIIGPIILLLLPADYFDTGEVLCPTKRFFDFECLGCGMTRAMMHLIHFDFESAAYFNYLSFIFAPILAFLWVRWTWYMVRVLILKTVVPKGRQ